MGFMRWDCLCYANLGIGRCEQHSRVHLSGKLTIIIAAQYNTIFYSIKTNH